jgi:hypothetical protein
MKNVLFVNFLAFSLASFANQPCDECNAPHGKADSISYVDQLKSSLAAGNTRIKKVYKDHPQIAKGATLAGAVLVIPPVLRALYKPVISPIAGYASRKLAENIELLASGTLWMSGKILNLIFGSCSGEDIFTGMSALAIIYMLAKKWPSSAR